MVDAVLGIVPIPDGWSFEEAAQLGVPPFTALQALHQSLELPSPFETSSTANPQRTILIWGGASAVGQYAIQFVKLYGLRVLATASSKNFDLLKGLGADEVFDYRDEGVVEKIRAATGNALEIAFDTISEGKTAEQVPATIGDKGGNVAIILPYDSPRPAVKATFSMAYDVILRVRLVQLIQSIPHLLSRDQTVRLSGMLIYSKRSSLRERSSLSRLPCNPTDLLV